MANSYFHGYREYLLAKMMQGRDIPGLPPRLHVRTRPNIKETPNFPMPAATPRINQLVQRKFLNSSLGDLEVFRPKVISMILSRCDVRSINQFMAASSAAKDVVEAHDLYIKLIEHAGPVLLGLRKYRLCQAFSVQELYNVLTTLECVSCRNPGSQICLVTCERACINCLNRNPRFWILNITDAMRIYSLPHRILKALPRWWTRSQTKFVSERLVAQAALAYFGKQIESSDNERDWRAIASDNKLTRWPAMIIPGSNQVTPLVKKGGKHWGIQFMHMNYLPPNTSRAQTFMWCEGCSVTYSQAPAVDWLPVHHGSWHARGSLSHDEIVDQTLKEMAALREWQVEGLQKHLLECPGVVWLNNPHNWQHLP